MYKGILHFFIIMNVFYSSYAQTEISLENYFKTLKSVKVEINSKTYNFLFDSGAGITMVSPKIVKELNKTVYGNNVGFRMSGEKVEMKLCDSLVIKIGGINFHHSYVGVFDIMSLLPKEFERIDGVISMKTLEDNEITLNLSDNKLIVETEDSFKKKIKNMNLIQSRFANGPNGSELNIFIGIKAYDQLWWFLFDSGNIAKTKISKNVAQEWDLLYKENEITEIGKYKFEIDGDSIATPTIIDNIIYDGALSYDFIQQSEFAISLIDEKIWMGKTVHNNK
jgi:hypothetical protein